jgi:hypothetical protein
MTAIAFMVGSFVLLGIAFLLIRDSSPISDCGAADYERRRTRRVLGMIVSIMAALCLVIALLALGESLDWGRTWRY